MGRAQTALRLGLAGMSLLGGKRQTKAARTASQEQFDQSLGYLQGGYRGIQSNLTGAQQYVTDMIPQAMNPMYTGGFYTPQGYGQPQTYPSVAATQGLPTGAGGITDMRYGPQGNANDVGGAKGSAMAAPTAPEMMAYPEFNQLVPRGIRDKKRARIDEQNAATQAEYDKQMAAYNASQAAAEPQMSSGESGGEKPMINYGQDIIDTARRNASDYSQALDASKRATFGYLDEIGTQGRKDINESYDNSITKQNQGMVDSGLYGSTVNATLNTGINRERAGSLSRLNEDIGQMKAGYESSLGTGMASAGYGAQSDILNAMNQQRGEMQGLGTSIPQNYINSMMGFAGLRNQNIGNFTTNAANLISGVNIGYPDQNQLISMFQNMGSAAGLKQYRDYLASQQSIFGGSGGAMFGGLGAGVGALLAAPTGGMSMLGGALIGGGLGYGTGTAVDRPW